MIRFPLWLASRSPRRRQLLEDAGIDVRVEPSDLDDANLRHGDVAPEAWVMTLAHFKARRAAEQIKRKRTTDPLYDVGGTVLAADTLAVIDNALLGQPQDADHARQALRQMRNRSHLTMTGVCLIDLEDDHRQFLVDVANVHLGDVTDEMIESYVQSDEWRGKAGGYNFTERREAGWPISCVGDPTTVVGLPMQRLLPLLLDGQNETSA